MSDTPRPTVSRFAQVMERKLQKHDHDWGPKGWEGGDPFSLLSKCGHELDELQRALRKALPELGWHTAEPESLVSVAEEAADVANMAMMVADSIGALERADGIGSPDRAGFFMHSDGEQGLVEVQMVTSPAGYGIDELQAMLGDFTELYAPEHFDGHCAYVTATPYYEPGIDEAVAMGWGFSDVKIKPVNQQPLTK